MSCMNDGADFMKWQARDIRSKRSRQQTAAYKLLALNNCFDSRPELLGSIRFEDVPARTVAHSRFYHTAIGIQGHKNYRRVWYDLMHLGSSLQSVHVRQVNVEQHDIGLELTSFLHRLESIGSFADDRTLRETF